MIEIEINHTRYWVQENIPYGFTWDSSDTYILQQLEAQMMGWA